MLPSFSVDVDVPERVGISDVTIPVRISAQYAFDKTVLEGKAVVKFSEFEFSTLAYTKTIHERTVEVESGSAVFSVDIMNDLKPTVNHGMHHPIEVHATFTDAATQQTITGTSLLIIRQFTYDVVFTGNEHYEEGKIYSCKLSFVKFDRTSVRTFINQKINFSTIFTLSRLQQAFQFLSRLLTMIFASPMKSLELGIVQKQATLKNTQLI